MMRKSTCMQVVLLGLYNGQGLEAEPEQDIAIYSRACEVLFLPILLALQLAQRV